MSYKKSYSPEEIAGKFVVRSRALAGRGSALECVTYVSGERAGMPYLYDSEDQARNDKYFDHEWDDVIRAEDYFSTDKTTEKRKYYQVSYIKNDRSWGVFNVKARNEKEAIANAKDNCYTGRNFKVINEIPPTKDTIYGGGSHRANKKQKA